MNKYYYISVRTESTRLKKKALRKINNKCTIEYLIENLKKSKYSQNIVLCTTDLASDDELSELADKHGIKIFRGSSSDKIYRWHKCTEAFDVDFFVNVDGDDLFFDYKLGDHILDTYNDYDFVDGHGYYIDVYGISKKGIRIVNSEKDTDETEYIRTFFQRSNYLKNVKLEMIDSKYKKGDFRMTLDYEEDFIFFENIINNVEKLDFDTILNYLEKNPKVKKINIHREESWAKNQLKYL
jgi:spore coat polysaccharide biosynthesis protein SpsF